MCSESQAFLSDLNSEDQGNGPCLSLLGLSCFSEANCLGAKVTLKGGLQTRSQSEDQEPFSEKWHIVKKKKNVSSPRKELYCSHLVHGRELQGGQRMPPGFSERFRQKPDSRGRQRGPSRPLSSKGS